jgi:hypothetical protein
MRCSIARIFFNSSSLDLSETDAVRAETSPTSPATAALPLADKIEAVAINVGRALCTLM